MVLCPDCEASGYWWVDRLDEDGERRWRAEEEECAGDVEYLLETILASKTWKYPMAVKSLRRQQPKPARSGKVKSR